MIQLAKDLFITSQNLTQTPKEAKNRDFGEKFANVLEAEDSRVVTKSNTVVDNEKSVYKENPMPSEQKFSGNRDDLRNSCVEELTSTVGNIFEKEDENEIGKEDETDGKKDDYINISLQISVPFDSKENVKNDIDLNSNLPNSQECEINDVRNFSDINNYEEYPAILNSNESPFRKVPDFSAFNEREARALNCIDGNLHLPADAENPEIGDRSISVKMSEVNLPGENDEHNLTGADLHKSFENFGFEENSSDSLNTYKSDVINEPLHGVLNNGAGIDKLSESYYAGNADFYPKIAVNPGKRSINSISELGESAQELSTDEVELRTVNETIKPVNANKTKSDNTINQSNEKNNELVYNPNEADNKYNLVNQEKRNIDRELNITNKSVLDSSKNLDSGNKLDSKNDSDNDTAVNRHEFQNFMQKISEQNYSLSDDPSKNVLKSQQMNLINKGRLAFTESVENIVRFVRTGVMSKAVLIIDPPALGRVNIELISTDKGVEAVLSVSNEQIKMLVQENSVQLKQSLEQVGVVLSEFTVDVQHDESRSRNQSFNNRRAKKGVHFGESAESEVERIETFRVDLRKGLLHWIA
ncbi:MAG: flagellar hook-length control protein FliK [Synergistaceae bacterium]|nr:flagellar hook-length control protein FliK [Synergistaceae bacterium]